MRLFCLLLLLTFASCQSSQKENQVREKELQDRLLKVHDRVMPKMETLVRDEQSLKERAGHLARLKTLQPLTDTAALHARINESLRDLTGVDHDMMDWMHTLDLDFEHKTHAEILAYMNGRYKSISRIDSAMQTSFATAGKLLDETKLAQ